MFTGLIQIVGSVSERLNLTDGLRLKIHASDFFTQTRIGDSVSVNGVCLSIESKSDSEAQFFASKESLSVTTLGNWQIGQILNLELAARTDSFLGGHLVQGHVDGKAICREIRQEDHIRVFRFEYPDALWPYLVKKGSIAIDGVSLTLNELRDDGFEVCIIPETWAKTNFSSIKIGTEVNIEVDILAKYVERQLLWLKKKSL